MNKTMFFIHGAFMTPLHWENWIGFFQAKGFQCLAPAWPYRDKPIEELRKNPPVELATLGIREIIDHYTRIIEELNEPPCLIGHSMGGLVVQILLDRGLGAAGVAITSGPPKGVSPLFYRSVLKSFTGLFTGRWKKVISLSFKEFQYGFVHTLSEPEQRAAYEKYVVPESRRIFWQAALAPVTTLTAVNFNNDHRAPLLLIAAAEDKVTPAVMNRANAKRYHHSNAVTAFQEFTGRTHWITHQPGWEEVADYIVGWLQSVLSDGKPEGVVARSLSKLA
ncbi:MAG: alpha/beta hydrolase [Candidatus Competibacteraceae bacterium]